MSLDDTINDIIKLFGEISPGVYKFDNAKIFRKISSKSPGVEMDSCVDIDIDIDIPQNIYEITCRWSWS